MNQRSIFLYTYSMLTDFSLYFKALVQFTTGAQSHIFHSPLAFPCILTSEIFVDAILNSFVWGNISKWQTLENPTDIGVTALPDFNLYYNAAQLSHLHHIDKLDNNRFHILLCSTQAQTSPYSTCVILHCLGRSTTTDDRTSLVFHYKGIQDLALTKLNPPTFLDITPLWNNKRQPNLLSVLNGEMWAFRGICYLHHLISTQGS